MITPIVGAKEIIVNKFINFTYNLDADKFFFLLIKIRVICLIVKPINVITKTVSKSNNLSIFDLSLTSSELGINKRYVNENEDIIKIRNI